MSHMHARHETKQFPSYGRSCSRVNSLVGSEHGSRCSMFRTSCSKHVRNMFRTSRIPTSIPKSLYGMPEDLKCEKFDIYKNCLHFSLLKIQILKIVISMLPKIQIPIIHDDLGSMFRTCSEHLVRNSVLCQLPQGSH